MENIQEFECKIGYKFRNTGILTEALTHKSFLRNKETDLKHYERLEFLGDAILEVLVSEYLYENFDMDEGQMTALRANLVNKHTLNQVGKILNIHNLAILSDEEKKEFGFARESIVANIVESLIAAIYVDSGKDWKILKDFFENTILKNVEEIVKTGSEKDAKTKLQEYSQKMYKIPPQYKIINQEGKDHDRTFEAEVVLQGKVVGSGSGKSKQLAEIEAAKDALLLLSKNSESTATS